MIKNVTFLVWGRKSKLGMSKCITNVFFKTVEISRQWTDSEKNQDVVHFLLSCLFGTKRDTWKMENETERN